MSTPRTVLVIGGGAAGNAVTILLRRAGIAVDLIEAKDDWNAAAGSGITLQGNALRVLRELGVWQQVEASGFGFGSVGITAPDGTVLHEQDDLRTGGDDLPATVGMQRPQLQQILIDAVRAGGATVRLGTSAEVLEQDPDGVSVRLSDGSERRYDLVIAADGLGSATRAAIGITAKPEPTGMAIWRIAAPRPAGVVRTDLAYGGPAYIAGYCPTSDATIYAYVVEANRDRASIPRRRTRTRCAAWPPPTAVTGRRSPPTSPTPPRSTTPGSTGCWWRAPGTAAESSSSATPRTAARPPSPKGPRCPWRTPGCSPRC